METIDERPLAELIAAAGASFASVGYDLEVYASDKSESGFHEFAAEKAQQLNVLAELRDEAKILDFLGGNGDIIEGIAHVRAWFFERHVGFAKSGRGDAIREEALSFFLLDAAADAARAHYARTQQLEGAAMQGVHMLKMGLGSKGDPVGIRNNLKAHVDLWSAVVRQAASGQKVQASKKMQQLSKKTATGGGGGGGARAAIGGRTATADPARALPALGFAVLSPVAAGAFSTILRCKPKGEGAAAAAAAAAAASGSGSGEVAVKSFDLAKCRKDPLVMDARDRELGILALLHDHPTCPYVANLLGVLGDCVRAPHCHAVLEYASGGSLKHFLDGIKRSRTPAGGMAQPLAAKATGQIAAALAHLHSLEIAHMDVKPANVLLLRSVDPSKHDSPAALSAMHLKLCDFGFATVCGDAKLTFHCGTPMYCAPELASPADASKGYLGRPVDMWALGCVLYEMLHGKPAFIAAESFQLEQLTRGAKHAAMHESVPSAAKSLLSGLICAKADKRLTAAAVLERAWVRGGQSEEGGAAATGEAGEAGAATPSSEEDAKKDEGGGLLGWMFGS